MIDLILLYLPVIGCILLMLIVMKKIFSIMEHQNDPIRDEIAGIIDDIKYDLGMDKKEALDRLQSFSTVSDK